MEKSESPPFSRLFFASDHAGIGLRHSLIEVARCEWQPLEDLGTHAPDSVDYSDYADILAAKMLSYPDARGVLICGSGIGISIAANRHSHIRAALCHDVTTARLARLHNDANVLCLGARVTGVTTALDILQFFLTTEFEGGRHARRVAKLSGKNTG